MKYKSVIVTQRGGLEVIQFVENELRPPIEGEARIRILATAVCQDDIAIRLGNRPFLKKPPFVPGYSFIGIIDAIGEGVRGCEGRGPRGCSDKIWQPCGGHLLGRA